jgi:hypothetical protein
LQCDHIRFGNIANEDVVARLQTIPIDRRLFPFDHLIREDCHDSGFAVRILTGSVDVCITEDRMIDPMHGLVVEEIFFRAELRDPVGRKRTERVRFVGRKAILFPVNGAARRRKNDALDAIFLGIFE